MSFDRKALIGFITEIEASRERAKGETRHQSDIFKRAREKQFDVKAMRKVLQRRAMSVQDRDSLDDAIDSYELALGSLALAKDAVDGGMSRREAAEKYNVPRAALGHVARGSQNAISDPPHDPDTGEVHDGKAEADDDAPRTNGSGAAGREFQRDVQLNVGLGESESARPDEDAAGGGERLQPGQRGAAEAANSVRVATQLRAQIPTSTDPGRLEREAAAIEQNAAPQTCVDDGSALAVADAFAVVPRPATPQAVEVGPLAAAPVPDGGVGAGTISSQIDADLIEAAEVHNRGVDAAEGMCVTTTPLQSLDTGTHSGGDAQDIFAESAKNESRSLELAASDSVASPVQGAEPVVPTGNEGRAGERDTSLAQRILGTLAAPTCAENAQVPESCGEPAAALGAKAPLPAADSPTAPLRPHDAETMASPEPETSSEGALSHSRASCGDHSRTDTCGEARGEARPNPDGLDVPHFLQRSRQEGRV